MTDLFFLQIFTRKSKHLPLLLTLPFIKPQLKFVTSFDICRQNGGNNRFSVCFTLASVPTKA
ncbi:hypothetical protein NQZ68_017782 [Dissostichus eleginoides]|nr:hypothetical protein NQZ68_017782 [Dissostichus eleginoides]